MNGDPYINTTIEWIVAGFVTGIAPFAGFALGLGLIRVVSSAWDRRPW